MSEQYNLNFMHPQYGTTLNVDIDSAFSVQEILEQLLLSGFIGKANAQYDLELMGQALEKQTIFASIPNLYNGAVLRVVELTTKPKKAIAPTSLSIQLHSQHPHHPLHFSATYDPLTKIGDIIRRAIQQGFLVGTIDTFQLFKGEQELAFGKNLQQLGLQEGDHLQFKQIITNSQEAPLVPSVTLLSLQEQVQQLQQQLSAQVSTLQQQLPRDQVLPNVSSLPYESLEKIVQRVRKQGKEPALSPLSLSKINVTLVMLLVLLALAGAVIAVLYATGNI